MLGNIAIVLIIASYVIFCVGICASIANFIQSTYLSLLAMPLAILTRIMIFTCCT